MKKKKINLYFIDLDGTTLDIKKNNKSWISAKNLQAIKEIRRQGKEVIISTGRYSVGMEKYIDIIGGRYTIMSNGAEIRDNKNKKMIFNKKINQKQILKIVDFAQKHNLAIKVSGDYNAYGSNTFLLKFLARRFHLNPVYAFTFDPAIPRSKILLWGKSNAMKMDLLRRKLENEVDNTIALSTVRGLILEVTHLDCTKGLANEKVAQLLKIPKEKTAHIGDTMNDSTSLDKVGTFIAMKNSTRKLKTLSKNIGPHYKNAGLAKILIGNNYDINEKYIEEKRNDPEITMQQNTE